LGKIEIDRLGDDQMITPKDEEYILARAYVPEQIISLMVLISKGEPFLIEDCLCYVKDNWLIFVGYPLDSDLSLERGEVLLKGVLDRFKPEYLWFIGQEIPPLLLRSSSEGESDRYYRLDLRAIEVKKELKRVVQRAARDLTVERSQKISKGHGELIDEFIKREKPSPRIRALFLAMPDYVRHSQSTILLNAWSKKGELSAFYVVELGAKTFATYVVGCHSKRHYVPQASDLLFSEMIHLAHEAEKSSINLGLGVNEGIRKFKEKWGGVPFLNYEFCEHYTGFTRTASLIKSLEGKL
jgi:hypothetical protein